MGLLDSHDENLAWREKVEEKKDKISEDGIRAVENWEKGQKAKL